MKKVAIVVPTYKTDFNKEEALSLMHLEKFLNKHDRFFVVPDKLDPKKIKRKGYKAVKFPSEYFSNVRKFSELTTIPEFYEQFTNYQYILVYHLDALVFSDQLIKWCNKGYDYIGAPLFNSKIGLLTCRKNSPLSGSNGGFSLRKVNSFIKVLQKAKSLSRRTSDNPKIRKLWLLLAVLLNKSHKIWLDALPTDYPFNEDGFWSFEAPKYFTKFKVAPFNDALRFSFETSPEKCFQMNNNKLPFGCHAWMKYNREFWQPYLLKLS